MSRARLLFWSVVLTGAGGVAAIACTLNPQPLPPETAAEAPGDKNGGGDTSQQPSPPMGVGDAGGGGTPDGSGTRSDGGNDTDATGGQPDGGDASIDAPLDGASDGATTD